MQTIPVFMKAGCVNGVYSSNCPPGFHKQRYYRPVKARSGSLDHGLGHEIPSNEFQRDRGTDLEGTKNYGMRPWQ